MSEDVVEEYAAPDEAVEDVAVNDVEDSESPESAPDEEPRQQKSAVQKRIDKLTREKYEMEAQAKFYAEQLRKVEEAKAQQPKQEEPQKSSDAAPKVDDYDSYEAYIEALTEYKTEQRFAQQAERMSQEQQRQKAEAAQRQQAQTVQQRITEGRAKYDDFDEIALSGSVPITQEMATAIGESELGADIAYYLGNHPDEAVKIATMSPTAQFRALGRLETKLEAQPVNKSHAPPPIKPVSKGAKAIKDPSNMSIDEWMAWRMKQVNG
jgi:hypothetical protein